MTKQQLNEENIVENAAAIHQLWENQEFIHRHMQGRQMLMVYLEILNQQYALEKGYPFLRFIEERFKTEESTRDKLLRKGRTLSVEGVHRYIHDLSGVRVICHSVTEIYWIAEQIKRENKFVCIKEKDYIKKPKKSGYESYHMILQIPLGGETVLVELQLRTLIMDSWACVNGRVSYKQDNKTAERKKIEKLMVQYAKIGHELDRLLQEIFA